MWGLALLFFVACASADCTDFAYADQESWGMDIECAGNLCSLGEVQSPVEVVTMRDATSDQLGQLRFEGYGDAAHTYTIDGESIVYNYNVEGANMKNFNINEVLFTPDYFSVHIPPEHVLPGFADDMPGMELQFHHSTESGAVAVVSFFFKGSDEDNEFLNFLDPSVISGEETSIEVNITGVQDWLDSIQTANADSYFYYKGSETVPPCSEPVHWHLMSTVGSIGYTQWAALNNRINNRDNGGNARAVQRQLHSVLYWDAAANAVTDPVCGGGLPNWNLHPYDCTDQYDHTVCFYCSGRANGFEAKNVCLNRNGKNCDVLFNTPEAASYCNLAFECPASTLSHSFLLLSVLSVLFAFKHFW